MLVEFSVANFRSFKDRVTLSMEATHLTSNPANKDVDQNNVFEINGLRLLKSAAIYGANASGKSNLAKALSFMKWFILSSSRETQTIDDIPVDLFKLSTDSQKEPSILEIVFLLDEKLYRYGFTVNSESVMSEWLYYIPSQRETKLFVREGEDFDIAKKFEAEGVQNRTRHNSLFLSVAAQFNVSVAEHILEWMKQHLNIISGLEDDAYGGFTISCLLNDRNKDRKKAILRLIKQLDLGIGDVSIDKIPVTPEVRNSLPSELKRFLVDSREAPNLVSVATKHPVFNREGERVTDIEFSLEDQESEGTQKIFSLSGPLVDTLGNGKILVVDEFDARLHPLISRSIIELFNSPKTNPNNAQLIFMTHDSNLLTKHLFRRDQIWFTEKDRYGATDLYSLAEYKVRNDASFERDYIKGRYGAIPFIGNLSDLLEVE